MASLACIKPYKPAGGSFRCGQCMPCRIYRAQVWKSRLLLEASQHRTSFFVTLTYRPECLPADGSVDLAELQRFFKRLRFYNPGVSLRYFAVGEYGERRHRPHYHAVLFGDVDPATVEKAWPLGFVHVGLVTPASAAYICGYVLKSSRDVPEHLAPEFARMSKRPAIGKSVAVEIGEQLAGTVSGAKVFKALDYDAPCVIRQGGKVYPLGRFLRNVVRRELGMEAREPEHRARARGLEPRVPLDRARAAEQAASLNRIFRSKKVL